MLDDLPENINDLQVEGESNKKPNKTASLLAQPEEDRFTAIIKEQSIKNKILRYKVSFGKYLIAFDYRIQDLDNLSCADLELLLQEIEICVASRTSGNMIKNYYLGCVNVFEKVSPLIGMNLQGLSTVLSENDAIRETLDELSIKYDVLHYTKPEIRLAYLTLQSIMAINSINKKNMKISSVLSEPVKKEVVDEFKDL